MTPPGAPLSRAEDAEAALLPCGAPGQQEQQVRHDRQRFVHQAVCSHTPGHLMPHLGRSGVLGEAETRLLASSAVRRSAAPLHRQWITCT
jgi:hypothetical protein